MSKSLKTFLAEMLGTFVLVAFSCGVAVYTGANWVATSLAFGLSIVAMAFTIGPVTGCHVNPAVSLAMLMRKRITGKEFWFYLLGQLAGALLGTLFLLLIFGFENPNLIGGDGVNTFGANAISGPLDGAKYLGNAGKYIVAILAEVVLTFVFVLVVLRTTANKETAPYAGLLIGLTLTLVHLLGLGITGTSVNPARSLFPAIFADISESIAGDNSFKFLTYLPIFIVGPFGGAALAALADKLFKNKDAEKAEEKPAEEPVKE